MIVLAGIPSEPPLRQVAEAAEAIGIDCVMLNQREAAVSDLELHAGERGFRLIWHRAGGRIDLSAAKGLYMRVVPPHGMPEYRMADSLARARIAAWNEILDAYSETAPIRVLNRLRASNSNMSKPYQAQIIAESGFAVPETLITNDPAAARAFRDRHGSVIFKSISAHRSIVHRLEGIYLDRLDQIRFLPVQFQRAVDGIDLRVHVIGESVFATEIISAAADYRYAGIDGEAASYRAVDLPTGITAACVALSRRLDLPLCGIDLRRERDGRHVCFEVNPSPAYSCFEEQTGQPIARAIACWLETGRAELVNLPDSKPAASIGHAGTAAQEG